MTVDELDTLYDVMQRKTEEFNAYITTKVVQRIIDTLNAENEVKLTASTVNYLKSAVVTGAVYEGIQQAVEKRLPKIQAEVKKAFLEAGTQIAKELNTKTNTLIDLYEVDIPKLESFNPDIKSDLLETERYMLESAYKRTNGELKNLTRTTAGAGQQAFVEAVDNALVKVNYGIAPNTAMLEAVKELTLGSIGRVEYPSGHIDKIETAVARAVRTGVNQSVSDITLTRCANEGTDLVITTQHVGARVSKNNDYKNHYWWQGKVYKLDFDNPELKQYDRNSDELKKLREARKKDQKTYPDFMVCCGYGKIEGICGINCRHSFSPFYPENINTNEPIDAKENEQRFKATQKQRALERKIRAQKRLIKEFEKIKTDDAQVRLSEAKNGLTELNRKYKEHCEENDLKLNHANLKIV